MFSYIRKIIIFVLLIFFLFIIKESVDLYFWLEKISPLLSKIALLLFFVSIIYFVIYPVIKIALLKSYPGPVRNGDEVPALIESRMACFENNIRNKELIKDIAETESLEEKYNLYINNLSKKSEEIRKHYVIQLFYSSSLAQNGFLDALLIFSSALNLTKEIFVLYNGRVSYPELLKIGKQIYLSVAIGGSDAVEYVTEDILSKLAFDGIQGIPFIDKILASLADGFVNAALLTRISIITENYCKLTLISTSKDLYPSPLEISKLVQNISSEIISDAKASLKKMAKNKSSESLQNLVSPIKSVLKKPFLKLKKREGLSIL